jgi:hypothetical protein
LIVNSGRNWSIESTLQSAATSATKSPIGVNRRNAVLFTRKKQAAAVSTPEPRDDDSEDDLENRETEVQSPGSLSRARTQACVQTMSYVDPFYADDKISKKMVF